MPIKKGSRFDGGYATVGEEDGVAVTVLRFTGHRAWIISCKFKCQNQSVNTVTLEQTCQQNHAIAFKYFSQRFTHLQSLHNFDAAANLAGEDNRLE